MRNIEPPLRRGSATYAGLIFRRRSEKSMMNCIIGASTSATYAALCARNHSRSLWRFNARRNLKVAGVKYPLINLE